MVTGKTVRQFYYFTIILVKTANVFSELALLKLPALKRIEHRVFGSGFPIYR